MTTTPGASRWLAPVVGTAVATALALGGTSWVASQAGDDVTDPGPRPGVDDPATAQVVAWTVASTAAGPRLVAELRTVTDVGSLLRSALLATLGGTTDDPRHAPVWTRPPELDVAVTVEGDLVEVDLLTDGGVPADASVSPLAAQALAWTVATATGDEFMVVDLSIDGEPPRVLPGVDGPVSPDRDASVLAPVVLTSQGEFEPAGSPVAIEGLATAPVAWELLLGTEVVAQGVARPEVPGEPSPFAAEAQTGAGEHLLRLTVTDPASGQEFVETTRFSVD